MEKKNPQYYSILKLNNSDKKKLSVFNKFYYKLYAYFM